MAARQQIPQGLAWYQAPWEELMDLLPVSDPDEILSAVRGPARPGRISGAAARRAGVGAYREATRGTVRRIRGIFGLDPNGIVRRANENALLWPEIATKDAEDLLGTHFFTEVAPCTNHTLFRRRFRDGIAEGQRNEQFSHTYRSDTTPPANLDARFYSAPDQPAYWITSEVVERY